MDERVQGDDMKVSINGPCRKLSIGGLTAHRIVTERVPDSDGEVTGFRRNEDEVQTKFKKAAYFESTVL